MSLVPTITCVNMRCCPFKGRSGASPGPRPSLRTTSYATRCRRGPAGARRVIERNDAALFFASSRRALAKFLDRLFVDLGARNDPRLEQGGGAPLRKRRVAQHRFHVGARRRVDPDRIEKGK